MVPACAVELTLSAVLGALRNAGLGEPHPVFAGGLRYPPPGRELDTTVRDELAEHRLLDRGDRLTDEFEDVLYALARAETEYVAYVEDGAGHYGVLVAVRGRTAVRAVCSGERVRLRLAAGTHSLAHELVSALPQYAAVEMSTFSLPQDEFREGDDGAYSAVAERSEAARAVDALFRESCCGAGEITVAMRGPGYRRRVSGDRLGYLDLASGRVACAVSGPVGNRYLTVVPGTPDLLAERVTGLRAQLGS